MKEMEYTGTSLREVLADETIDGFRAAVFSLGTHPTAYVMIPDESPLLKRGFDVGAIMCHGGVTYSGKGLPLLDESKEHYWIGWDYAHFGDYCKFPGVEIGEVRYTTRQMMCEAREVITQLKAITVAKDG